MSIEALPATLIFPHHVCLYVEGNPPTPHVFEHKADSDSWKYLFSADLVVSVPAEFQTREGMTRAVVAGIDATILQARLDFEQKIQHLERTRQQFLALEA